MKQIIIKLIALMIIFVGVLFIYDARILSDKWFGFGDQNQASSGLKIIGFVLTIIGGIIL